MINLTGVNVSFSNRPVLSDVGFSVASGERVSIVGPGGCGKTTLLKSILGLIRPDQGTVKLMDVDMGLSNEDEKQKALRFVGMAFQQGALFDFMSVKDNLLFAMQNMDSLTPENKIEKVKRLLAGVKLARTENMLPFELSGGMQRRVGIARALAIEPKIAIFDEPTSGLDPVTSTIILNMIIDLEKSAEDHHTLLIATTNVEIALRFADRVIVMNDGKIVADGLWQDLLLNGPEWVKHFLSVRLIGLDLEYARELRLPEKFISLHW